MFGLYVRDISLKFTCHWLLDLCNFEVNLKYILINRLIFSYRYGDCHPVFFIGSLEAAFQEAFYVKARDVSAIFLFLVKKYIP